MGVYMSFLVGGEQAEYSFWKVLCGFKKSINIVTTNCSLQITHAGNKELELRVAGAFPRRS